MKAIVAAFLIASVLCCISNSYAVPPAYEGPFGNPEEPALRVVKWTWLGFRKLVVRTHEGLQSGLQKESLTATGCEGAGSAWSGCKTLADHTARGLIYAPLPPKASLRKTITYEQQALAFIEAVTAPESEEAPEITCEPEADVSKEEHAEKQEEPKYLAFEIKETDVEKAQRRYVPNRVAARDRVRPGTGNLLQLAR